jgi:hexosaminidase
MKLWPFVLTFSSTSLEPLVNPLPAPRAIRWSSAGPIGVSQDLQLDSPDNFLVENAFNRSLANILQEQWIPPRISLPEIDTPGHTIKAVKVEVADQHVQLQHGVDESYTLDISRRGTMVIKAATNWGALHGLRTFEQLVIATDAGLVIENPVSIQDEPLYPYRGLMVDTARNFYSVESLLKQIETMSLAKMNVFHWHLTDHQSWPVFVRSHPEMVRDAYTPKEVYTEEDVQTVVRYAYERGIRVIPELDLPGHSAAGWRRVSPEIVTCLDVPWETAAVQPTTGQLEILSNKTYEVLDSVYQDISRLFVDNFFHVGFDELNVGCYRYSAQIQKWLGKSRNYHDLAQYWVDHALPVFERVANRRLVMWQDSVLSEDISAKRIPKDVIMQSWSGGMTSAKRLLSLGYDVIISTSDFLYLDCGIGDWVANDTNVRDQIDPSPGHVTYNYGGSGGSWCAPYKTWQRIYNFDFSSSLTASERKHVLGATAALWSEQSDSATIDGYVWPRLGALAELLWSGNKNTTGDNRSNEFTQRILEFRQRLILRGINAAAIAPKYCLYNRGKCDHNV